MTGAHADVDTGSEEDFGLSPQEVAELTEAETEAEPISYSGTDFDAEGLVRRLDRGDIVIPTFGHGDLTLETAGFQRGFVWRRPQMDRFIESLLLGYPIPGIMLVQQADKRYLVLDGQQRLRTLSHFYSGIHQGKEFALQNVADEFKELTYRTLSAEQRRQIDNTFIQATIVRTDSTPQSLEAVYQVFERLNSGGTQLTPHEIRIALYPGELVDFLSELNDNSSWRALYGAKSPRLRDQELVLRILAMFTNTEEYERPLKKFLNKFVGDHRNLQSLDTAALRALFVNAADRLLRVRGRAAIRYQSTQVNTALSEALFVGLMRQLEADSEMPDDRVLKALNILGNSKEMAGAISGGTATEEYVRTRISLATEAFAAGTL